MKKSIYLLLFSVICFAFIGCNTTGDGKVDLNTSGLVDYQTDVPMLAYAFCKIKPEAAPALSKFCVAVQLTQDKEAILKLIEQKLTEYSSVLLEDEYTRKWLIAKAKNLIGVTIDPKALTIINVDEAIGESKMREIILLVCEGVRAYLHSTSAAGG